MGRRHFLAYLFGWYLVGLCGWFALLLSHCQFVIRRIVVGPQPWISLVSGDLRAEVPPCTKVPKRGNIIPPDTVWSGFPEWEILSSGLVKVGSYRCRELLLLEPPLIGKEEDPLVLQVHNSFYPTTEENIQTESLVVEDGWAYLSSPSLVPWSKVTGEATVVFSSPPSLPSSVKILSRSYLTPSTEVEREFLDLLSKYNEGN